MALNVLHNFHNLVIRIDRLLVITPAISSEASETSGKYNNYKITNNIRDLISLNNF